ncbi:hypothetical protein GA0115240_138548 [Streptomyces sp. DvalAA-14]|uniref:hypothetical protein n=1 Tax=unclassified Streptomyces TaxID=2593676 RepID=UPI00081B2698|nr:MULTISPECIES: hypothetical protein [unclassified Streptomyces]MYS22171.1 hypothetical protein [Streptomyces sp. SID4948]SCE10141.1 hypothetical protein GA0115240_138548 [Streptomyces sp. DvalAA-14]
MGFINGAKANSAASDARKAIDAGQSVLVYKFIEANTNSRVTGPMLGIADQIQAVESQGWALYNMAVGEGKALSGDRVAIVCLFRRNG